MTMVESPCSFLYALSEKDRKELGKLGFRLMKSDEANHIWVFEYTPDIEISNDLLHRCVLSDIVSL